VKFIAVALALIEEMAPKHFELVRSGALGIALIQNLEPVAYLCSPEQVCECKDWIVGDSNLGNFCQDPKALVANLESQDAIELMGDLWLIAPRHSADLPIPVSPVARDWLEKLLALESDHPSIQGENDA